MVPPFIASVVPLGETYQLLAPVGGGGTELLVVKVKSEEIARFPAASLLLTR